VAILLSVHTATISRYFNRAHTVVRSVLGRLRRSVYERCAALPVNYRKRDTSNQAVDTDGDYAIKVGKEYLSFIKRYHSSLNDKVILEIGPGINFGSILLITCQGAKPMVADKFLSPWEPEYHPRFYEALRKRLATAYNGEVDLTPLDRILQYRGYPTDVIRCIQSQSEDLHEIPDNSVDVILSNAVLEHLVDPVNAFQEFYRISRANAFGFHQVDFRDHRDFAWPLEYLLLSPEAFMQMFHKRHGECGSQWRSSEMRQFFMEAGFTILNFEPNMFATDAYLRDFEPRLRAASESRYRNTPYDELRIISGHFSVFKQ
jgi:hypothetical protein